MSLYTAEQTARMAAIGPFRPMQIAPPPPDQIEDSDLVAQPVSFVPGEHSLQYHGGQTITNPGLVVVRVGPTWWGDWNRFIDYCNDTMTKGYLSKLTYAGFQSGSFIGSYEGPALSGGVTDAQLQQYMRDLLAAGTVPGNTPGSTIYSLMLPSGLTVTMGGSQNCTAFCGYHTSIGDVLFTVQPASDCRTCNQGDPFNGATMVEGHEIAETCSDPFGSGWWEDKTGMENSDIVSWIPKQWGSWIQQGYADPSGNNVIGEYGSVAPSPKPSSQCHDAALTLADAALRPFQDAVSKFPTSAYAKSRLVAAKSVRDAVDKLQ